MKRILFSIVCFVLMAALIGCEKIDQAFEAIDKAKSIKTDLEKKGNEIKEKTQSLVPESARGLLNEKKESKNAKEKENDEK